MATIYDDLLGYSQEALHLAALNTIEDDVDKRKGAPIWDATAPAAWLVAKCFDVLYQVAMQSRVQTATGEYLDLCAAQSKIYRLNASPAKWEIMVKPDDVTLDVRMPSTPGTKFVSSNGLGLLYEVIEQISPGRYVMECATPGAIAGSDFGPLHEQPVAHALESVSFVNPAIDGGRNAETDAEFRMRWWSIARARTYGGNFYDYKTWVLSLFAQEGGYNFDAFFFFPAWEGGGTVKIVPTSKTSLGEVDLASPSAIGALKQWLDPTGLDGKGAGYAPVGHEVTVATALRVAVNVSANITFYGTNTMTPELQSRIVASINRYFENARKSVATGLNSNFSQSYVLKIVRSGLQAAIIQTQNDIIQGATVVFGPTDPGHSVETIELVLDCGIASVGANFWEGTGVRLPFLGTATITSA